MRPIQLRRARTNNLRDIDLDLEPGTLVAITGPSGAGKSSLAFGTLYAEGQRRYVESFSAYARQFLERLARPPVDSLEPVPAAVAVDRSAPVRTSRSTVATMTEISDYAKTLWARCAVLHCPECGRVVQRDDPGSAARAVIAAAAGSRVAVTFPVRASTDEALALAREGLAAQGYARVLVDDEAGRAVVRVEDLDAGALAASALAASGHIQVVADRTGAAAGQERRLVEAIAAAMHRGSGRADVHVIDAEQRVLQTYRFSDRLHCAHCDRDFRPASPGLFSFNSPIGACPTCRGFGRVIGLDVRKVLPDPRLSLAQGAIRPWRGDKYTWERSELERHCRRMGVPWDAPVGTFDAGQMAWLLDGDGDGRGGWWGVRQWFEWLEQKNYKMHVRVLLARYRSYDPCPGCHGARLRPEALWWRHGGLSIAEFLALPVASARAFLQARVPGGKQGGAPDGRPEDAIGDGDPAVAVVRAECLRRLRTLGDVGLDYLELDRASRTLSGGEAQRVALTGALGASLAGALIVLDEPTVGLHPRDVDRLAEVIERLPTADNTVLVVEHDWGVIGRADRVIELGPGAGAQGGRIVFDGPPGARAHELRETAMRPQAGSRRAPGDWLTLRGATGNNLAGGDVAIPRGLLTCVTGPSGSGKSSLVLDTLAPAVAALLGKEDAGEPLAHAGVDGVAGIGDVVVVDQAPLGRTARGNPATYVKAWDWIRGVLARTDLARERGYTAGTFSFNVPGGRCETCKGEGAETVEMQFLADVSFSCPDCGGRRFVGEVLDVEHAGKNVVAILDLTVREALEHFASRKLERILGPVVDVGLGYLRLGQPLNTLSGGEAQRLKLAEALGRATPGALLVLDEPTAGLHATDVHQLLGTLQALVERGDTVVVIEHDMDVAAHADWVIDLGPGAGAQGGRVVASGTPEHVARARESATAPFLAARLAGRAGPERARNARGASRAADSAGRGRDALLQAGGAHIEIAGAREHNLAGVSLAVPRERMVVVTGPSGSGKSTLAFDVLYAEGQRRYLETLSPYARQYLPRLPRPAVDRVAGVPPSVALEQRIHRSGASSTVATITEVAHYLRVLYARAGLLHCPDCGVAIAPRSPEALARDLRDRHAGKSLLVLAPVVRGRKGMHREILARARERGMERARIDGALVELEDGMTLARHREHDVDLVVAELAPRDPGLVEAVTRAAGLAGGSIRVLTGGEELYFSTRRACPSCGTGFPELDPRMFSFNTRQGACERCEGRGVIEHVLGRGRSKREVLAPCPACAGTRLSRLARSVTVDGRPITDILGRSVSAARELLAGMRMDRGPGRAAAIAAVPVAEVRARLAFLEEVGVGYLDLDRPAPTLSGGELQRVRLAAQLGSGLTGILYVLDEPTIGLHPRDTGKLIAALRGLVDRGNSLVVVEHDSDTIRAADHVIDIGPGGGRHGGRIVAQGPARAVLGSGESPTAAALARPAPVPVARRPVAGRPHVELRGARLHNLHDVDVRIPLGCLVVVTGVSGSGKSTLIREVLLTALESALGPGNGSAAAGEASHRGLQGDGLALLRRAVEIDQSPIGRTSRSVPATYIGIWDQIRGLLASTPEARARGYGPARFSFNVAEGRCPTCAGQGTLTAEMAFLPDVEVPCDACGGMRFAPETLDITWRGLHAGEILALEVEAAVEVFAAVDKVARPLRLLADLGLGYLKLGQPSSTLSGGEAQRLKLVSELGTRAAGGTLYVMDEPTTGLHRNDVGRLLAVFERLVARGDTAVVIEHHLDVMLMADWIIDLGPEGGAQGGRVVACGTPEEVAARPESHTGAALARELRRARGQRAS